MARTKAKTKPKAKAKKTKSKDINRISRYTKEKARIVKSVEKALQPMFRNLFDDLHKELIPLWQQPPTFFDAVVHALTKVVSPGVGQPNLPAQAGKKAKSVLQHYNTQFGIRPVTQHLDVAADDGDLVEVAFFGFEMPKLQSALKKRLGDPPPITIDVFAVSYKGTLQSADVVGLSPLELADLRIVKEVFDDFWALRRPLVPVIKIH
jgi:hypothetical protein